MLEPNRVSNLSLHASMPDSEACLLFSFRLCYKAHKPLIRRQFRGGVCEIFGAKTVGKAS